MSDQAIRDDPTETEEKGQRTDADFLDEIADREKPTTVLGEVMAQVNVLLDLRKRIEEKEAELSVLCAQERKMDMEIIPDLLSTNGLSSLGLSDDRTLTIKEDISVGIPKDEANKKIVLEWLSTHGAGDIIVDELTMTDPDEEVRAFLTERGITYGIDRTVNANKLKSWFRGALGMNKNTVARISKQDAPKEANLFPYRKTLIK